MGNFEITAEALEKAVVSEGNLARLCRAMKKARRGERVTYAAIGGSITQGCASTEQQKRYADLVMQWWKDAFPQAELEYVNAGIGATGSVIGVHRLQKQVVAFNPDFVTVDFAVNDLEDTAICHECYANLVRRVLDSVNKPACMLLFLSTKDATNAQRSETETGLYYDLPMISYRDAVWAQINEGKLAWEDVAADEVHPNDYGHSLLAKFVTAFLDKVYAKLDSIDDTLPPMPTVLISERYKNAVLLTNKDAIPIELGGFDLNDDAFHQFPEGWTVAASDRPMVFNLHASSIGILYLKRATGANGKATVKVNGNTVATLNADFAGGWGDYAAYAMLLEGDEVLTDCAVEITPMDCTEDKTFTILGLLVSN